MLALYFLLMALVVCHGQESSTAQPVPSSTSKASVEKEDVQGSTQGTQPANPLPFRNYRQQTGASVQDRRQANPVQPAYQSRRLAEQNQPRSVGRSAPTDISNQPGLSNAPAAINDQPLVAPRSALIPNQPVFQSRPAIASNQPIYQPGPASEDQLGYTYRQGSTQARRVGSPDQPSYQPRPSSIPDEVSYKPYSFNYVSDAEDGYYTHRQSADDTGKVIGSYSFALEDGRKRVVEYIADQNGFRANIDTNEPGTSSEESPADVVYYSSAPGAYRPVSRSIEDSSRPGYVTGRGGAPNVQGAGVFPGAGVQGHQGRRLGADRPVVTSYQGSGIDSGISGPGVTSYQGPGLESGAVNQGIQSQGIAAGRPSIGANQDIGERAPGFTSSGVETGPAFNSFIGSRSGSGSARSDNVPAVDGPEIRGAPISQGYGVAPVAARNPGLPSYRGFGTNVASDSVFSDDESLQAPGGRAAPRDGTTVPRSYQGFGTRRDENQQDRLRPSNQPSGRPQGGARSYQPLSYDENVPVVDYHAPHVNGASPYYYYLDNGNYWYHRH